jgi:hypothetical protein
MKFSRLFFVCIALAFLSSCDSGNPSATNTPTTSPSSAVSAIIDHTDVDASVIPDTVIAQIKGLDVYFEHASVGGRITGGPKEGVSGQNGGLDLLANSNSRYVITHAHFNDDPGYLIDANWPKTHDGYCDYMRGNPGLATKISEFNTDMRTGDFAALFDVAMFKFCWIDIDGTAQAAFDSVKTVMEALEAKYPSVVFVWWTQPIIGQNTSQQAANKRRDDYNALVRNYCSVNKKYLFDIADIECHAPDGTIHKDTNGNYYVDASYLADEGHPNEAGATRLANAWWFLMARICGWNG